MTNITKKEVSIGSKPIVIFDNAFTAAERMKLYEFAVTSIYTVDRFSSSIPERDNVHRTLKSSYSLRDVLNLGFFKNKTILKYISEQNMRVRECYVNLCTASDTYHYHTDTYTDGVMTAIYYLNLEWKPEWEGETHFSDEKMEDILFTSAFIPGRTVFFDGSIPHKSSQPGPLAEFYRFVLAVKFSKKGDLEKNYNNAVKIEDFIFNEINDLSDKEKSAIAFIKKLSESTPHDNQVSLYTHLLNTFYVLKHLGQREEVCLAGLFHAVYGTEFFQTNFFVNETDVIEIIGSRANDLVKEFSLQNRDVVIIDNLKNFDNQTHLDLLYILYANIIEQAYRHNFEREFITTIRSRIDLLEENL